MTIRRHIHALTVCPALFAFKRVVFLLLHQHFSHQISLLPHTYPITNSACDWSLPDTPSTTAHDKVAWAIVAIGLHPAQDTTVDLNVVRNVTNLATGKRPANRLPRAILLQIHSSEWE